MLEDATEERDADSSHRSRPRRWGSAGLLVLAAAAVFTSGIVFGSQFWGTSASRDALFDEQTVTGVFDAASPAVVEVDSVRRVGEFTIGPPSTGSGFLIDDDGHLLTNHHIVAVGTEFVVRLADGRQITAERLGMSQADDLAVLKVDPVEIAGIDPLLLADSSKVRPGQMAIAIGSPFREFNSISVGVVSGVGRRQTSVLRRPIPNMIQTDVPLNPGNSGGPLLNAQGEVIGVNSSVRTETGGNQLGDYRIGFAVPSNTVVSILAQLKTGVDLRRPWIGISGTAVTPEMKDEFELPDGIFVSQVFSDSPARRAGILPFRSFSPQGRGDVITAIDDHPVESVADMVSYLNSKLPGDRVTITLFRNGDSRTVEVALDPWPDGA